MGDPGFASVPFPHHRGAELAAEAERRRDLHCGISMAGTEEHSSSLVQMALDGTELRTTREALQRQNRRLQLLLNLMNQITSSLDLHKVLQSISANLREVMLGDIASVSLHDAASGKFRLFVLDFPSSKGLVSEGLLMPLIGPGKTVFETRKPLIANIEDLCQLGPEISAELAPLKAVRSICLIPLANRGRVLGILMIGRTTGIPFAEEEVAFLNQVASPIAIAVENALAFDEISDLKDKLTQERLYLEEEIRSEMGFERIIGDSTTLKNVLNLVETVAPTDSTVLLLGETGTGKELIARAIHDHSRRKERTFVKLNCAAIPSGLLESELFGHEKGAFTGAISQKVGRMELADQGTLFLDEVGDIPTEIQPKLLRALQEREFERLGSTHTRKVNIRLVAATNRNLEKMIADREFRSDLFYRLNVFPIRIPPLRERREDIPLLTKYFVQKLARQMQKKIESVPVSVIKGLTAWDWPGNIRELENFIERAVILTRGESLEVPVKELASPWSDQTSAPKSNTLNLRQVERETILAALRKTNCRISGPSGAAALLGMKRTTLQYRMRLLNIKLPDLSKPL